MKDPPIEVLSEGKLIGTQAVSARPGLQRTADCSEKGHAEERSLHVRAGFSEVNGTGRKNDSILRKMSVLSFR